MRKWSIRLGVLLLVVLLAGLGTIATLGLASLPSYEGENSVAGLGAEVIVARDEHAIPTISARSERDAYQALGFVHGQDRLWQMELQRLVGRGRMAEIVGSAALPTDRYMRTLGLAHVAQESAHRLDPDSRALFQAYADGVNAAMAAYRVWPPEFLILRHRPEPWTLADSVLVSKLLALELAGSWRRDVLRARLLQRLGPDRVAELFPGRPRDRPVTMGVDTGDLLARLASVEPAELPSALGSNVFVLGGDRTRSGKPILASDPHLQLRMPGHWYLASLHAPGWAVAGGTIPGLPAVVIGRNRTLTWGLTNTGADTTDLFLEKPDPTREGHYLTPEGSLPFIVREERIRVRGAAEELLRVRSTRHGPVVSDLAPASFPLEDGLVAAFAWTALVPTDVTASAGLAMARATDAPTLVEALRSFRAPVQNVAMADDAGRIGLVTAGDVPVRRAGDGTVPVPGWTGSHDWIGVVPFTSMPQRLEAEGGLLLNANNPVVDSGYPYLITADWDSSLRARRLEAMLEGTDLLGPDDAARVQLDIVSGLAGDMLPLLRAVEGRDATERAVLEAMRKWDGEMSADRFEPLLFSAWYVAFSTRIYRDELGDLYDGFRGLRADFVRNVIGKSVGWCDDVTTSTIESCGDLAATALTAAIGALGPSLGADPFAWRWGEVHRARLDHQPFDRVPMLRWLFNRMPALGGDAGSVNVASFPINDAAGPFEAVHAAGLRLVVDLALPGLDVIAATGQSGHPMSRHYADLTDLWAGGRYAQINLDESNTSGSILLMTLLPASTSTRQ